MERNVSCLNSRVIIEYVKQHYPELMDSLLLDLDPFFDTMPDPEEYLLDEHNWFSQRVCVKLFERLRLHSGVTDVARLVGRESVVHQRFGYLEKILIKSIGNPYLSILRSPYINNKLNRTKIVDVVGAEKTHALIRLRWYEGLGTTKDICLYNQGVYEGIPTIWGLPYAQVVEHMCFFEGAPYCEYNMIWTGRPTWKRILGLFGKHDVLRESLEEIERSKAQLAGKYVEVENLNKELSQRIERLTSLNACSQATASILDTDLLMEVVMSLIVNVMRFDRAILLLVDEKARMLRPVKGIGDTDGLEKIKGYGIPLDRAQNILARIVDTGIAQVVPDVDSSFLHKENIIIRKFNPRSFVAVPLITRNKVIGVLAAERLVGLRDFTSNDLEYMMGFCSQIAISLENARLMDSMKTSFVSSILSLATALEAKDPYTRGHSNRVATYSTILARKLGMTADRVDSIRLMALMHDIGKIGVPDHIIMKPEGLTAEEFSRLKQHPVDGVRIIESLVEKNPELRYIRSHHERYDGNGYPDGLKGERIPIEARILAVADSFDAMTSNRPYRSSLDRDHAIHEIERNIGTQFCPETARLFLEILQTMPGDLYRLICDGVEAAPISRD